jgi:hypothetical protein
MADSETAINPVIDFEVGQQVTLVFGGDGRLIKNKIQLPGVVIGITAEGNYDVRTAPEGVVIDIAGLGREHILDKAI